MGASDGEYEIRIKGKIGQEWEEWFGGLQIQADQPGETMLRGPIRDQAELHGILDKLSELNLFLISVNRVGANKSPNPLPRNQRSKTMKSTVISYSLTGNNEALARAVASKLSTEHIKVEEKKGRATGTIALDMLLNRIPKVSAPLNGFSSSDYVFFVGPVWMGKVAAPLRGIFEQLKGKVKHYAFISISGGADGPNPKLEAELTNRMGVRPAAVIDLHIADLLPSHPSPSRKVTSAYRLHEEEVNRLSDMVLNSLKQSAGEEGE